MNKNGNLIDFKCQKQKEGSVHLDSILNLQAVRDIWVGQKCAFQICRNVLLKIMTVRRKVAHFYVANHHTSLFISLLLLLFPGWEKRICVVFRLDTTVHKTNEAFKALLSLIKCNCLQNSNKGTLAPSLGQILSKRSGQLKWEMVATQTSYAIDKGKHSEFSACINVFSMKQSIRAILNDSVKLN